MTGASASNQVPADSHVHSEWSWDARDGAMEATCARALELNLPGVAFTEHWDITPTPIPPGVVPTLPAYMRPMVSEEGMFVPTAFDVERYAATLAECRGRFPELRILSGVELGEPHLWEREAALLLNRAEFERVLASVHCVEVDDHIEYVDHLYAKWTPEHVVGAYLEEVLRLVESATPFSILAHIDYPIRNWPAEAGAYRPERFEDEHRAVLRALARSGRALELNTSVPLHAEILNWWRDEGGRALSFGSDAHEPSRLARGFAEAREAAATAGFRPGANPHDLWIR